MNEKMMDARRRERELIGLRGVPEAWSKSPIHIEQYVLFVFDNVNFTAVLSEKELMLRRIIYYNL